MSGVQKKYCIFGCDSLAIHNVPFHRFPNPDKRPELFTAWVSAVSVNIGENNPQKIYKNKRICDHHFETKFKTTGGRLVWSAVPTIFDRVKLSINIVVDIEHNYCHSRRESSHATLLSDVTNIQNDLNKTGPSTSSVICHPHVSQSKFDSEILNEELYKQLSLPYEILSLRQFQKKVNRELTPTETYSRLWTECLARAPPAHYRSNKQQLKEPPGEISSSSDSIK
ncbi:unnamed protein product [Diatraea saccharalis]|uniref:THAP-type domain-containing protein n=1 Tax=Diatraea saccharalis TaxID=40085 RepID=A0A9N9R6S6_9NEOP|nr:unnamed protein product [Diatraea saccharalis]